MNAYLIKRDQRKEKTFQLYKVNKDPPLLLITEIFLFLISLLKNVSLIQNKFVHLFSVQINSTKLRNYDYNYVFSVFFF